MNAELSHSSDIAQLPLSNHTEVYIPDEEGMEQARPLTVADLQDSLARWKGCEELLGEPVPSAEDILADEKAVATLTKLHTTHKALIASGARIDKDNGEMPTLLANELQLVALPWNAFRRYADKPRQLIKDIYGVHQQYFDDAAKEGTKHRVIDHSDEYLEVDLDDLKYHQPGESIDAQESIDTYIDRKIEEEGPWGFMLIQKGEYYMEMKQFPITDLRFRGTNRQQRFWAGDTRIAGDNLGILEWSALLAQRTPDEVTNEQLPVHNLDTALYANPCLTEVENSCYGDPGLPDEPEFEVSAKLPMLRQCNTTQTGAVFILSGEMSYNAAPFVNTGRIAVAANTDTSLLNEIIEDGAKLHPNLRLPYTWAKRQLEGIDSRESVVNFMRTAGVLEESTPSLMDILESSEPVSDSLGRLHLAQLFYEEAELKSMGIETSPLCYQGGQPMGKYSRLELMPWQALLDLAEKDARAPAVIGAGPMSDVRAAGRRLDNMLTTDSFRATTLESLPQYRGDGTEVTIQTQPLRNRLIQKVATEGPWGLALRSRMPQKDYDSGLGKSLFTL